MNNLRIKEFDFDKLPEVYQIETTNACQLNCWMCGREFMKREIGYVKVDLIKAMIDRDEFASSYLVELQMYGEPTLHPELHKIIRLLKTAGVKVGMSTNAVDLDKHTTKLRDLDYLTISMDAATRDTYNAIRRPTDLTTFDNMLSNLDDFLKLSRRPFVDIQAVVLPQNKAEIDQIFARYKGIPNSLVRTVEECFEGERDSSARLKVHKPCLNPLLSVSIMWDGSVMPCCFAYDKRFFGPDNEMLLDYGNLNENSLREIWAGDKVKYLRRAHLSGIGLPHRCLTCIYRSPALLHWRMAMNWLQAK